MNCANGHELAADDLFCSECGAPVPVVVEQVAELRCGTGHPLKPGQAFCGVCGSPVANSANLAPARVVPTRAEARAGLVTAVVADQTPVVAVADKVAVADMVAVAEVAQVKPEDQVKDAAKLLWAGGTGAIQKVADPNFVPVRGAGWAQEQQQTWFGHALLGSFALPLLLILSLVLPIIRYRDYWGDTTRYNIFHFGPRAWLPLILLFLALAGLALFARSKGTFGWRIGSAITTIAIGSWILLPLSWFVALSGLVPGTAGAAGGIGFGFYIQLLLLLALVLASILVLAFSLKNLRAQSI